LGRGHATVCHAIGEWARDDDGDGIREVHDNTLEGMWTGLRNHLRIFRGVNKEYLHQYVAIFEWSYNVKRGDAGVPPGAIGYKACHQLPDMSHQLWSAHRVAEMIRRHFAIDYHTEHVHKIIRHRLHWSSQKPQPKARQSNTEKIDH
jgi:Winged helix-turn helix